MSLMPHGHQSGLFVRAPLDTVAKCILSWYEELERELKVSRNRMLLEEAWAFVDQDRTFIPDRAFLIPLGDWTAYFDGHSREFISSSHPRVLCARLKVETSYFSYDDRTPGMEGSAQFGHVRYVGGEFSAETRQVMVTHDGGWQFDEYGDALPFEQLDRYKLRRKADRLNVEVLRDYGAALGIPFWDEIAYGDQVVQIEQAKSPEVDAETAFRQIVKAARRSGLKGTLSWLNSRLGIWRPPEKL